MARGGTAARLAVVPLCVALILFLASVALLAVPNAVLAAALMEAALGNIAIAIPALAAVVLVWAFWRRHRVSGLTMLAGLIAVALLSTVPSPAGSVSGKAADLVHVAWYRASLQHQVEALRLTGTSPPVAVVVIDGFASMASGVAFDPTGEILLPADARSPAWRAVTEATDLRSDTLQARHVVASYYAWFHY